MKYFVVYFELQFMSSYHHGHHQSCSLCLFPSYDDILCFFLKNIIMVSVLFLTMNTMSHLGNWVCDGMWSWKKNIHEPQSGNLNLNVQVVNCNPVKNMGFEVPNFDSQRSCISTGVGCAVVVVAMFNPIEGPMLSGQ